LNTAEAILSIAAGLAVNEFCDISPWVARKISMWSARVRYGTSARAEIRAEELAAVIDSRPGKLFKLLTALAFACGATTVRAHRAALLFRLYLHTINGLTLRRTPPEEQGEAIVYTGYGPVSEMEERMATVVLFDNMITVGSDFNGEVVFRSFMPADSPQQASGRANRRVTD
jgi:hypothetical protein